MKGRAGQRVYWHGPPPRPWRQGRIKRTGLIRHEVEWDNGARTIVDRSSLMGVSQFGKCCDYCKSLQENGVTI